MPQSRTGRMRLARAALRALAVAGGALGAGVAGGALLAALAARTVVTPPRRRRDDVRILAATADTVTLGADQETRAPGRYGLWFPASSAGGGTGLGHARLGDVLAEDAATVTRRVERVDGAPSLVGARAGRWSGWYYRSPADLGLEAEELAVPTEFGPQPAWLIRADQGRADSGAAAGGEDWAVLVHGRGVTRAETLRAVPVLREAGLHCLCLSYRNDPDSPASLDRRYALGSREWRDVEAALALAEECGARRFVLGGWSMGGATVLQTLALSERRERIRGLLLDSPVVDWREVLEAQARARRLPPPVRRATAELLDARWGGRVTGLGAPVDLARLDWVRRADELDRPVLLLHSRADRTVPFAPSAALAARRPDLVRLEAFDEAQHTRLWNTDPARWNAAVAGWLSRLP